MYIPDKVKIGYKDYAVKTIGQLDDGVRELYGSVDYDNELIRLCNRYSVNQQKCALIHEIIHAIDDMYHIGLSEKQVVKFAKGLYQVIKDNPEMLKEES